MTASQDHTAAPARQPLDRRLSVAPMMDCTDRHYRYLARQISRHTLLYTEMVTTGAVLHGPRPRLLGFDPMEHPLALQLGGSDPAELARAAEIAQVWGYDEVNLNVGCPSDRVRTGRFGACLLKEPETVAAACAAMRRACDLPVTVKTRIGVDDVDSYDHLLAFVDRVAAAGVSSFALHARKAWLQGLSPKENREVPPLDYARVRRLKADRPQLEILLNGGLQTLHDARAEIAAGVDGAMIGRAAYADPWMLADADPWLAGRPAPCAERRQVVDAMVAYARRMQACDVPVKRVAQHMLGLASGLPGARHFRRHLSEHTRADDAAPERIAEAWDLVEAAVTRAEAKRAAA
ncbi:tRNA dihydrouridine(20/20a) synthase DusA [Rhodovibrio sodomensis]|uniref:tRNA-dihydrouridine(20/20a) synthase n=1 Tax=Rhodovibrio sodomensis TaxID=1088 RepID=A0ABS1DF24_9PROT|nr:tRNA dihydrouridine(20/20a) synthase DusA [Rhodovibrio sodomensis]MBK1668717.1 tRNA dihydrouridine(20/20a) synthase DusA [Rhodovibrio sodomensis]